MTKEQYNKIMETYDQELEQRWTSIGQEIMWQYEENWCYEDIEINQTIKLDLEAIMVIKGFIQALLELKPEDEKKEGN